MHTDHSLGQGSLSLVNGLWGLSHGNEFDFERLQLNVACEHPLRTAFHGQFEIACVKTRPSNIYPNIFRYG
jgi:hypothetical protein